MLVWWGTEIECASALARHEREKSMDAEEIMAAVDNLEVLLAAWDEVPPSDQIRRTARRLLRVHPLRAADALQLAAAIAGAESQPPTLEFVTLDQRLADAARREGFPVRPIG
jgi:predicted nucleic acid-binding protein